jgi:PKD repeat protein
MRSRSVLVAAMVAIAVLCGSAFATDYFVANDGDNGYPGTIGQPWQTITYAWTQVGPGDTINVRAGVYPEGRIWIEFLNGTPDAYITFRSYDGDLAAKVTGGVCFWQCHYVKWIGFDMEGGHNGIMHVAGAVTSDSAQRSQYIYVERCYIHHPDGQTDLVKTNQSDYLCIQDNELAHNGGVDQVIDMVWVTYSVGRRNYVWDWGDHALFTKGGCMYCTYEGNVIVDPLGKKADQATRFGGSTQSAYHNPATPYQSEYTVYRNNVIRDAANGANATYDCYYAYFYNNTVHNCGSSKKGIVFQHSDYGDEWSRHLFYFNNVFLDTAGDMGKVYAYENGNYEDWQTGNNNYYNAGNPIPSDGIVDPNQEAGATFGNPNLANPTGSATTYAGWLDCYRITASSAALIDQGNSNAGNDPCPGVHADIEGTSRPQGSGWDIGAFELVSGPVPPVAEFSGNPTSGPPPLTVYFTDLSSGDPTSWDWTFGDSGTSQAQHPSHEYTAVNTYTVSLEACNPQGCDTETKVDYIEVSDQSCHVGAIDLVGKYKSTGAPSGRGYYAEATITVHDQDCAVLAGVTVDITWSGCVSGSDSDVTDENGQVVLNSPVNPDGGEFTCCVDNLTKDGYPYNSGDNHETCDTIYNP